MSEISQIRALIKDGKSDAVIQATLRDVRRDAPPGTWDQQEGMLRALVLTMHRAHEQDRIVGATEVMVLLKLFRALWEEVAANGDAFKVNELVLDAFLPLAVPERTVSKVFVHLERDMATLVRAVPAVLSGHEREERIEVERRHLRVVGGWPLIVLSAVALAIADASESAFLALVDDRRYREALSPDVLRYCVPLLLADRPTFSEIVIEAKMQGMRPAFDKVG